MTTPNLPPLPDVLANDPRIKGDMVRHIRDYASAAIDAYRKSLKPVAWTSVFGSPVWLGGITKDQDVADGWQQHGGTVVPLYRLDDQP